MANTVQTLEQDRAASAWKNIEDVEKDYGNNEKGKKEYGSLVRGLPAMILSDGLAQTLAFLLAKSKSGESKSHTLAYKQLSDYVCQRLDANPDLLKWVLEQSSGDYRRAATEALAYLHWLKRFAEAKNWQSEEG